MSSVGRTVIPYAIVVLLLTLLAFPAATWLVQSWMSNPFYSHGFLVPLIALLFAWRQFRRVAAEPRHGWSWAAVIVVAALAALVWAMRWQYYLAVWFSVLALILGILLFLEGWARVRHWLFPILFLGFMVPLPFIDLASPWLEAFTARSATSLAQLVGIDAVQQGGEITLPGSTIVVGAPCSGLRSLIAMITVGVAWVYLVDGRPWAKALMLLAIVPLVAISNVVRISILLALASAFGEEVALGYYHDWSSPILFLVALGLLLLVGKLLRCSHIREDLL